MSPSHQVWWPKIPYGRLDPLELLISKVYGMKAHVMSR